MWIHLSSLVPVDSRSPFLTRSSNALHYIFLSHSLYTCLFSQAAYLAHPLKSDRGRLDSNPLVTPHRLLVRDVSVRNNSIRYRLRPRYSSARSSLRIRTVRPVRRYYELLETPRILCPVPVFFGLISGLNTGTVYPSVRSSSLPRRP